MTLARADRLLGTLGDQTNVGQWTELHCEFHDTLLADRQSDAVTPSWRRTPPSTASCSTSCGHETPTASPASHLESTMAALRADRAAHGYGRRQQMATAS